MGKALYRKYRPKSLAEVVGQDPIITTLTNALASKSLSHAYLFTGPRGVGKTSIARILAHEINGIAYTDDEVHLDIIEIDAASNRRIDEIRDLRDKIHIAPTSSPFKVYIIDEVHMLTREAFNALLKTLEEPPAHVIFILATTEAHKVPETIASRTQRFSFKAIQPEDIVSHLQSIAKKEGITVSEEALYVLADHANGSFRDSINLLDQLASGSSTIHTTDVHTALGTASEDVITQLMQALQQKNAVTILETLGSLRQQGTQAAELAHKLMAAVRALLAKDPQELNEHTMTLMHDLLTVQTHSEPFIALELALLKQCQVPQASHMTRHTVSTLAQTPQQPATEVQHTNPKPSTQNAPSTTPQQVNTPEPSALPDSPPEQATHTPEAPSETPELAPAAPHHNATEADFWQAVLQQLKGQYTTLYNTLRMADATIQNDTLTLAFQFAFHQKQIAQAQNIEKISSVIVALQGTPLQIKCVVKSVIEPTQAQQAPANEPTSTQASSLPLADVSNIFDGAELLE